MENAAISTTEQTLLEILRRSLRQEIDAGPLPVLNEPEGQRLLAAANRHEVLPLVADGAELGKLPAAQRMAVQEKVMRTVHKAIQLQLLNVRLTALLEQAGIRAVTLKGWAVARLYPVPEFRKSADLDLFVARQDAGRAVQVLQGQGFRIPPGWQAHHHVILDSQNGAVVELHTAWTDDFRQKRLNQAIRRLEQQSTAHCRAENCADGRIWAYEPAWQGLYLLLHMLMHFVGSGFGLRNLCDWVVLWESCDDPALRREFWELVRESGITEFAGAVTATCIRWLGLAPENSPVPPENLAQPAVADALLRDILDGGEFGYGEQARMVGMDGTSWAAYLREFQHQMHLNFPRAGQSPPLWPALWLATLVRFLYNNHRLHRAPVAAILKKAGGRGELASRLLPRE